MNRKLLRALSLVLVFSMVFTPVSNALAESTEEAVTEVATEQTESEDMTAEITEDNKVNDEKIETEISEKEDIATTEESLAETEEIKEPISETEMTEEEKITSKTEMPEETTSEEETQSLDETENFGETPNSETEAISEATQNLANSEETEIKELAEETAVEETKALAAAAEDKSKTAVDGDYEVSVESNNKMFKVTSCMMTVKDGKYSAKVTLSGTGYDKLYLGTAEMAATDTDKWISYVEENGAYTFTFEVTVLDTPVAVAAHSVSKDIWYDRTLTFSSANIQYKEEVTDKDSETTDSETTDSETTDSETTDSETTDSETTDSETADSETTDAEKKPEDGDYTVTVESDSKMFKIVNCVLRIKEGTYTADITLSGTGYTKLYPGTSEEAASAEESQHITYSVDAEGKYVFTVPVSALDKPVAIAAFSESKQSWLDRNLTFKSEGMLPVEKEEEEPETPSTEEETDTSADIESDHVIDPDAETTVVDNTTTIKDGVYIPDAFEFSGGSGKTKFTCDKVTIVDGKAYATIKISSSSYASLKASGNIYTGICEDGSVYTIPVVLNAENTVIGCTTAMSEAKWITYTIQVTLSEESKEVEETEKPDTNPETETPDTETETTPDTETESKNTEDSIANGTYTVDVTTSTGKMFKVIAAVLTNDNGAMTAKLTLSGTGYDYLYLGSADKAVSNKAGWIRYTANAQGQYVFEIPVAALDTEILLVAHSSKNDTWYERGIIFNSATLKLIESSDETSETTPETEQETEVSKKPESESKYETDLSKGTSRIDNSTGLADGVYTPDSFSWSGGSGRTSITCSKVTVSGGQAYATIVFGSSNYGYVKANGNKYYPTYGAGTSSFTIPVKLNANNTIIGMTTAMSSAHEVTYTIYIYIAGADKKSASSDTTVDKNKLSEAAPEIIGLEYKDEAVIESAEYFKIYYYDQGITMIEIDMASDTDKPVTEDAAELVNEEQSGADVTEEGGETEDVVDSVTIISELYQNNVVRYLVVPENAEVPVGLEKEMIMIQMPVESIYTDSLQAKETITELDKYELITVEKEEAGLKPEYKELILNKCDLAVLSDEFLWNEEKENITVEEQSELLYEITERLTTLGIPVIVDRSADEQSEAGAAEWMKVYEVIFGENQ